jgi:hypothetical protein
MTKPHGPRPSSIEKFDIATIDSCISLIEEHYPEEWRKIASNEAGPPFLPNDDYQALWYPIRVLLHKQKIADDTTDLIVGVRKELRKRLGLPPPAVRMR